MVHIHPLSRAQLERVMERSEVVERDGHGIKVLRLSDGRYLKYFRRKRFFNRELLSPAAVRFARHARQLERLRIPTLTVESLHRIIGEPHTVAVYQPMPGDTLRALLARGELDAQLMYRVGCSWRGCIARGVFPLGASGQHRHRRVPHRADRRAGHESAALVHVALGAAA